MDKFRREQVQPEGALSTIPLIGNWQHLTETGTQNATRLSLIERRTISRHRYSARQTDENPLSNFAPSEIRISNYQNCLKTITLLSLLDLEFHLTKDCGSRSYHYYLISIHLWKETREKFADVELRMWDIDPSSTIVSLRQQCGFRRRVCQHDLIEQ